MSTTKTTEFGTSPSGKQAVDVADGVQVLRQPSVVPDDPGAPSTEVSSKRQRFSDFFTIFCAGFALISDGYQNNLMTMSNVVFKKVGAFCPP